MSTTTITPGQTFTTGQSQILTDTPRSFQWYIRDDNIPDGQGEQLADDTNPNGWNVAYNAGTQIFTVTAPPGAVHPGDSLHAAWIDGAAPSTQYFLSNEFGFAPAPPPGIPIPTLSATPSLPNNVPSIILTGF